MERLTERKRNFNGTAMSKKSMIDREGYPAVSDYASKVLTKLADYEDAEEQGLLLRLPCKVGDKVYQISENFIEQCTVETIFLGNYRDRNGNWCNMAEIYYDRYDCPYVSRI